MPALRAPRADNRLPQILGITAAFFALEIPLARWAFRLGLRDRPY